jgi:hypothetical protein
VNAINVIAPYKYLGMWVFDDPRVGLSQEPFVSGADSMIDRVVADIPNAEDGFVMLFADSPFPGIGFAWNGVARTQAETGTTLLNSTWKAAGR